MRLIFLLLLVSSCVDGPNHAASDGPAPEDERGGELNGTCAPEGEVFTDHYSCDGVEGPSRGDEPPGAVARVDENPARALDPDLPWVQDQLAACSCICCHNNNGESAHIWSWDFEPVWTDSIETDRLERMASEDAFRPGDNIDPTTNNGFSRVISGIPSTDGERLMEYLRREVERR
ncbi:MAG: hypothetical protein ACI9MC_002634 [Kiritimatiellia bacterium]|jgi:hypothetical protein